MPTAQTHRGQGPRLAHVGAPRAPARSRLDARRRRLRLPLPPGSDPPGPAGLLPDSRPPTRLVLVRGSSWEPDCWLVRMDTLGDADGGNARPC